MEEVYEYLLNELNLQSGNNVIVGVSGGPDSMALLHLFYRISKALDIKVICAHVNHNVRKESEKEKEFVEQFCRTHSILFETMTIEEYGEDNFHNEARSIRYTYFESIVQKYHALYLFTAHHGDDLMETILMRMVRGSTLKGYAGFSKIIAKENYQIIRPFIELTKDDILKYNKQHKINFVTDSSNEKDVYTRNRFRKYIVPNLRKEDVKVHKKFYKFSTTLLEYNEYIEKQVNKIITQVWNQKILNIPLFLEQEKVIANKILYFILEELYQDDLMLITDQHVALLYQLILSNKANVKLFLPNQIKAVKQYDNLLFTKEEVHPNDYDIQLNRYVNLPNGKNIEVISRSTWNNNFICRLDSREITLPLHIRNRKNGDKMTVKGMLGSKKINDIFIDSKIPMEKRETWPIVTDSKGTIIWLPGLKKSKFDKQNNEKYDIILKYY